MPFFPSFATTFVEVKANFDTRVRRLLRAIRWEKVGHFSYSTFF